MSTCRYQILALDPEKKTTCEDAKSVLYCLLAFTRFWQKPILDENKLSIRDDGFSLQVSQVSNLGESGADGGQNQFGRAFIFNLSGDFTALEVRRLELVRYLADREFSKLYVLMDEVSERIACELYPKLYRVENALRGYLTKFFTTQIGPAWWKATSSREMTEKVKMRKSNETVFGKHLDNSALLIDFDELGEMVYDRTSGFVETKDIVDRIMSLGETSAIPTNIS